jgi:hypothetical protein
MKRILLVVVALTLCFCVTAQTALTPDDGASWSEAVNGLQARLSFTRRGNWIRTYLELRRDPIDNRGAVLEVPFRFNSIQFEVIDEQGKQMELSHPGVGEAFADFGMLRLPLDSSMRVNITGHRPPTSTETRAAKETRALLDLTPGLAWEFRPGDKHSCYLRSRLSIEKTDDPNRMRWSGAIELPAAKIPTSAP